MSDSSGAFDRLVSGGFSAFLTTGEIGASAPRQVITRSFWTTSERVGGSEVKKEEGIKSRETDRGREALGGRSATSES